MIRNLVIDYAPVEGFATAAQGALAYDMASSGIFDGGLVTINADPTKFDVSAGSGWIVAHASGAASVATEVTWSAFTAQAVTNLATSFATDIAINISGAIVQQDSYTDLELRSLIKLGGVDHSNQISILNAYPAQRPIQSVASNVAELARAVGDINLSGNNYGENGANLSIDKSGGVVYSYGRNNGVDSDNPSKLTTAAQTALEFGYVYNNGSGAGTFVTPTAFIDPDSYDDGTGTLATVANNKFTIQRILYFANANSTFVQYGTEAYNSLTDALDAVPRASFDSLSGIRTAQVRGYIIVKQGSTVLNGATTSFLAADKFGNVAGLEAGSTTATWGNIVGTLADQADLQEALIDTLGVYLAAKDADQTAATNVAQFRLPACTIQAVRLSCTTAPTGSIAIVDINEGGTSILSTKLSIDATELTSLDAATAVVISDTSIAANAAMTVDFDQIGSTVAGQNYFLEIDYIKA